MVWIYGGGFNAGGTSEPRQDGGHLAGAGAHSYTPGDATKGSDLTP